MLTFEPIEIKHRQMFLNYIEYCRDRTTEQSFAAMYGWSHKYKASLGQQGGLLYARCAYEGHYHYLMPLGAGDLAEALRLMEREAERSSQPFSMRGLTSSMVRRVEEAMPGRYRFSELSGSADYLYASRDLIELSGKRYHSKRNFIKRFETAYEGRWHYEDITADNLDDVWDFQDKWCRKNDCASSLSLQEEGTTIALLLYNLKALGAYGGLLRVDGEVVAFTVGSPIGRDTMDINIEKADYEVVGAYPMINRLFARSHCADKAFINREEDLGLEGLRRAKLSYAPTEIITKYAVSLNG